MTITDITKSIKANHISGIKYKGKTISLTSDIIWNPDNYLTLSKDMVFDGKNFTIFVLDSNNNLTSTNYWSIISIDNTPTSFSNAPIIKNLKVKSIVSYQSQSATYSLAGIVSNGPYYYDTNAYVPINYLYIVNCKHYGDVFTNLNSVNTAGCAGIVGELRNINDGKIVIKDCYQIGNIYGYFCGGIVNSFCGAFSQNSQIVIDNCHTISDDTTNSNTAAWGGIVGSFACINSDTKMYIKHCTFKGMIDNYSGGIVGLCACSYNGGSIYLSDCNSNATIGLGSGGICGPMACSGNITLDMYSGVDLNDFGIYYGDNNSYGGYIQLNRCHSKGIVGSTMGNTNDSSGGLFGPMCCCGGDIYIFEGKYYNSGGNGGKVKVYDCYSIGSVGYGIHSGSFGCGGLFGSNACYGGNVGIADSPATINGGTGGFIYVKNCYSHGSVDNYSGGLFSNHACFGGNVTQATAGGNGGTGGRIKVIFSHSIGDVNAFSGGLFGPYACYGGDNSVNENTTSGNSGKIEIKYCYSIGKITNNSGGLIGYTSFMPTQANADNYGKGCEVTIKSCYVIGNVESGSGGLCASRTLYNVNLENTTNALVKIKNCYFKGNINSGCGGIFGTGSLVIGIVEVKNCYISDYYSKTSAGPIYVPSTITSALTTENIYTIDLETTDQNCLNIMELYDDRVLPEKYWVKIHNDYPQLKNNLQ